MPEEETDEAGRKKEGLILLKYKGIKKKLSATGPGKKSDLNLTLKGKSYLKVGFMNKAY